MAKLPYAEDVNYWMTGKSSPDIWVERARHQITELGGKVTGEGFGQDGEGRAAFMLQFTRETETYRVVWPVLQSFRGNERAARAQAATMLYHPVKALCLAATVLGTRAAFFSHLLLPDGRQASQLAGDEIASAIPALFAPPDVHLIGDGR